jgi:hypothetical protein
LEGIVVLDRISATRLPMGGDQRAADRSMNWHGSTGLFDDARWIVRSGLPDHASVDESALAAQMAARRKAAS